MTDRAAEVAEMLRAARGGARAPLARLLSIVERGGPDAACLGRLAHGDGGRAYTVGITGAPGGGKSTLTNAVCAEIRRRAEVVAVLAIDPSSPFSGGAILGDRVRMGDHALDDGVYIRSMATRGHLGGLALATPQAVRVLDAVGKPWVLIETVGVGQVEVEIAGAADTTVVVVNPGWGDGVQANKAGLMEIADVFAINKADRDGVADTRRDLEQMLGMAPGSDWTPPIVETVATEARGVGELWEAVLAHRSHIEASGELERRRRRRVADELGALVTHRLAERLGSVSGTPAFDRAVAEVCARREDPWTATDGLLAELTPGRPL